ncbi:MAG: hypothetical protein A3B38_03835 [Candidatus Levybacteria bacterium RIFCSPLOWO2_01_FULL_36_13]|nr:MAG: hypothetical protein A2684_00770 [Candidatus Levybacteria bacterium RIFCSPHIGHO2_01_FULL_36_15b]OGH34262.1 MAG: hypothetical protein A3B38_03835 [Candidatus Levybacteria bacterium RIFCSPLOWO2_01_FULL_36_13]
MKRILLLVIGLIFSAFIIFNLYSSENKSGVGKSFSPTPEVKDVKIVKASFAIFTNNIFRIFSDPKYHFQSKDVYMEEANIIIVKTKGITWDGFFKTLPMKLTKECLTTGTGQVFCTNDSQKLRFFINGKEDVNALAREVNQKDKLLVSFGNKTDEEIKKELQQISTIK